MKWGKITHIGKVRSHNEDCACERPDLGLFAVADGMGGHQAGEVASKKAIECLEKEFEANFVWSKDPGDILKAVIEKANQLVYDLSTRSTGLRGMGTTITACCIQQRILTVAHVGDSRCYLIRRNRINRLTRDHSLVEEMLRNDQITYEEAQEHPYRNVLTRALGTSPQVQVDLFTYPLLPGDIVLLCTDGVTEYLSDDELVGYSGRGEPQEAVQVMLNEALNRGGIDNITLVIVAVD